ncbi:hypothetical protein HPP92_023621 [Vanilla planifolia]|uniref:Uncharacterized protein n=1 Tax=Vanilla planifolia TaxID=51239 RepID=A0A835PRT8_VANPL|nr:hypothetical protein HPP92_023621 [Vanilla planifolia]
MAAAHPDSATMSNRPDYVAVSTRVDDGTIAATVEAFVAGETREVAVGLADLNLRLNTSEGGNQGDCGD